jgi:myo-inositol-1(or 4)-monophosphatase
MSGFYDELLAGAVAAANAGSSVLRRYFRSGDLDVARKGENDFVTRADRDSEAAVLGEIRRRFPGHRILAEEGGASDGGGDGEYEWLVDPLDGTTNFLQGLPIWCISVACRRGDLLVAAAVCEPPGENLFTAARDGTAGRWRFRIIPA